MISKQPSHAFFLKAQDRFLGTVATWLLWMLPMFVAVRINELLGFALINEQVMKLVFLGGGGLLLLWRASVTWLLLRSLNVYLLIFIGWGWCSFLWSIEPRLTFLRMLTLSGYVLVLAAFMVYDWSQDRFHAAMRATLLFIVLLSFAVWFMDPRFVTEVGEDISLKNSWKGVTLQKNVFGQIAACSTVFWLHSALTRESGRRWAMAGVLASLYGVVLSRSSTALLATVPTCGLLWLLLLAIYTTIVARRYRRRMADPLVAWALVVMLLVTAFFFFLALGPTDAFQAGGVPNFDQCCKGPNPLLQNHVLVLFHPPILYLGFVGFTVPFAFAIAGLITGRVGEGWLMETRRWALLAWGFLSVGILLGGWWSYEVLGWGGYWGWDPVENASLLPWLSNFIPLSPKGCSYAREHDQISILSLLSFALESGNPPGLIGASWYA